MVEGLPRAPLSLVVDNSGLGAYMPESPATIGENPTFGGGKGGGPMEPSVPMRDYVDARDDAVESRLAQQLGALPTANQMRNNIWGAAAAILGILLAALAFGSGTFNGGMSVSPIVAKVQEEQRKTDASQDAKLEMMDRKLDILIQRSQSK